MKKIIMLIFLLMFMGNSYGQHFEDMQIHLGLVANTIVTKNYLFDDWAKNSKEMNILISKCFYRSSTFFLQPEIGYIQKGYRVELETTNEHGEFMGVTSRKFYGHFIHVLLPAGIQFFKWPQLFVQAGPRLTYKAGVSDKFEVVLDKYKTWMPGLVIATGGMIPVGNDFKIGGEVRYDFDLTNGVNVYNDLYDKKVITKLNAWMFNLIFAF